VDGPSFDGSIRIRGQCPDAREQAPTTAAEKEPEPRQIYVQVRYRFHF
jgi:hypothetical protein